MGPSDTVGVLLADGAYHQQRAVGEADQPTAECLPTVADRAGRRRRHEQNRRRGGERGPRPVDEGTWCRDVPVGSEDRTEYGDPEDAAKLADGVIDSRCDALLIAPSGSQDHVVKQAP